MDKEDDQYYIPKEDILYGKCTLQIRFETEEQYNEWKQIHGGKSRWDFITSFPAIMKAEYTFSTSLDVDILTRTIIQQLQNGFNVRAVDWKLTPYESLLNKE